MKLFEDVLLLEDEPSHALLIKRSLKDFVVNIAVAGSMSEAEDLSARPTFDLVLADLNLPDTTGTGHVARLRSLFSPAPVIVLTSSRSLAEAVQAMRLGASDFLVKDFSADFPDVLGVALSRVHATVELERERARYAHELTLLEMAVSNSADGFAIVDRAGTARYANQAFRSFLAACSDAAVPAEGATLRSPWSRDVEGREELSEAIGRNLDELPSVAVWHTLVVVRGGAERAFDLSLSVLNDDSKVIRPPLFSVWVKDVSESRRRDRFQRDMVATTTHDLKGPLGSVLISTELLEDYVREIPRAREIVLRIASSTQGAVNLIDEFLSARRIQEGTFILKPVELLPEAVVRSTLEEFAATAEARGISVEVTSEEHNLRGKIDPTALKRVIGNLISNALKFTPKNGSLSISILRTDDHVAIDVADTGSGMEPGEVQKIFDRFSRLDRHRHVAGSGLGLFVVRSLVEAHGGRVEVVSRSGKGTNFRLFFPLAPPVNERGEVIALAFA